MLQNLRKFYYFMYR